MIHPFFLNSSVLKKTRVSCLPVCLVAIIAISVLLNAVPVSSAAPISTTTAVGCTPNSIAFTSWTKCTATVTGSSPSGTVSFTASDLNYSSSGTFDSATCTLSGGSCSVFFSYTASSCIVFCQETDFQISGSYGGDSGNLASSGTSGSVRFHSCWFDECLYNTSAGGDFTDYFCVVGNNPTDSFADCKAADTDYSSSSYDLSNQGIEIPGAGFFASMAVGCVGVISAITFATNNGYASGSSPGQVDSAALLSICALGYPLYKAGADTSAFFGGKPVPDEGALDTIFGLVLAGGPTGEIAAGSLAVFVDLGCGFVNYYCYGANLTGNVIANPFNLQAKPVPFFQTLLSTWGAHNGFTSIGWSLPSCTDSSFCTQTGSLCGADGTTSPCLNPPKEGTAGEFDTLDISHPDYSKINTNAPIKCATGHINDLSIGYDGDVDFNVNSSSVAPLVNPHNEEGGALGPPNGIVAEIPPADRGSTSITPDHQPVSQTILKLRKGMLVHICGRWVTDTRDLWNELHPITSLQILPDFTVSASPSDVTVLAGGQTSFSTTVKLVSGPTGNIPIQMSVLGLPSGASANFTTNPIQLNNPNATTGTSTLQVNTSTSVTLGDSALKIQGTDQSGFAVQTATVNLHTYDFTVSAPSELLVLQTGKNSWTVTLTLTSGSTTTGLPVIGLSNAGLPSGATSFFTPSSGSLSFTSTFNVTTVSTAAGNYTLTLTGTDGRSPEGGSRTISRKLVVLTPQQALQLLISQISVLRSGGILTPAQASSLTSQLAAAISSLNGGKVKTGCNQLSSFVNAIKALVRGGVLSQTQANQLLNPPLGIYAIMASIPC